MKCCCQRKKKLKAGLEAERKEKLRKEKGMEKLLQGRRNLEEAKEMIGC